MGKLLIYCILFTSLVATGQTTSLYFNNISTENGLSNNKVNCILQDKRGFVWIGTDDGLNRYDGYRFQHFRFQDDTLSISGNIITDILEDKDGLLWIATADGGLSSYNYRLAMSQQFRQYKHAPADSNSIPGNIINALEEDLQGNLWIATRGFGLLLFNKTTGKFKEPVWQKSRTVLSLTRDEKGKIWAGREGGGMVSIDPVSFELTEDSRYRDVYAKLPHMTVAALYRDSKNDIWIGSWDKVVYRLNTKTGKEEVFGASKSSIVFPSDDPLAFAEDKLNQIWVGGQYNGLYIYNRNTGSFQQFQHDPSKDGSLADNRVNCIFLDRSGNSWIGTNRGISIHYPSMQQFSQTFLPGTAVGNIVYDFAKDKSGRLFIGTSDGMYIRQTNGSLSRLPLSFNGENLAATKFFFDEKDEFYIGTNLSLFKYTNGKLTMLPNTEKDLVMRRIIESRVVSMVKDSLEGHEILLVSPYGHFLVYYDFTAQKWVNRRDTSKLINEKHNIKDNLIRKIYKSTSGEIWIATVKAGLGRWEIRKNPRINYFNNDPSNPNSIGNNNVYDLAENTRSSLWVTTFGGGLYHFDVEGKRFDHIKASHNLAEGVQVDKKGNVWMIANGNLHRYDPFRKQYTSFRLPDAEKAGGVKGYIYKDHSGDMFVGGNRYFIQFDPDSILDLAIQPKVMFTDFKVLNKSRSDQLFKETIQLKYDENFVTIDFTAPYYQEGNPVQYAHKLEGFDQNWIEDGSNNSVSYTNLDGGTYTFRVRSTVKPGQWSEDIASIRIVVVPPFWKTWWFYLLCAASLALLIFGIYRYRVNEILKRQAIRNKIAQDLHDNVGSTLSSISVYSQVAKIYKQTDKPAALQDTLEKISETSSEMISEMNDIVWAINPRNDNMATILQRMESFARPLLASKEIRFHFDFPEAMKNMQLDMTKRKNFYLIFKEAINNALKYANAKNIWVDISHHKRHIELKVKDDGIGFDTELPVQSGSLSGNGLRNIQLRAREVKGECSIISEKGGGTAIVLTIPIP